MGTRIGSRAVRIACVCALASACGRGGARPGGGPDAPGGSGTDNRPAASRNDVPADVLSEVLHAHREGSGTWSATSTPRRSRRSRSSTRRRPGGFPVPSTWRSPCSTRGESRPRRRRSRGRTRPESTKLDQALILLSDVLRRDPENPHAHYSRGIILQNQGRIAEAHEDFQAVTEIDPTDGHAWFQYGSTLLSEKDPNRTAGPDQSTELIAIFTRALECNPYLVPALYRLQQAYSWRGDSETQSELIALFQRLNPKQNVSAHADTAETSYGAMGRYASIIDWNPSTKPPHPAAVPPRFDSPSRLKVSLPRGDRWATAADYTGARRSSVGPGPASEPRSSRSTPTATAGSTCSCPRRWSGRGGCATCC